MAGWLSRTTSLFQQPLPTPEPFEVECDCGGKVTGQRGATYQKPICPVCERPVFVLPANVYPRPKPKVPVQNKANQPAGRSNTARGPSNTLVDPGPAAAPSKSGTGKKPSVGRGPVPAASAEPESLREPRRPFFSPLRLISLAMFMVTLLTVGGLWHRNSIETAKATVAIAADAGQSAIRERKYTIGAKELERARLAVDLLGRKDPSAEEIRRLSREATVLANLASNSLTEFLEETLSRGNSGQKGPLRLASLDKNAWVIFDTSLIPVDLEKDRFLVDAPLYLRSVVVDVEIESKAVGKFIRSNSSAEPQRVIFAAQLDELSAPEGEPRKSVLTLNGKTAILWTSYETYNAIGYHPSDTENEEQTKSLLERQLEAR